MRVTSEAHRDWGQSTDHYARKDMTFARDSLCPRVIPISLEKIVVNNGGDGTKRNTSIS